MGWKGLDLLSKEVAGRGLFCGVGRMYQTRLHGHSAQWPGTPQQTIPSTTASFHGFARRASMRYETPP